MPEDPVPAAEAGTLYGLLRARAARDADAVAYRQHARNGWQDTTWAEALTRADALADNLFALGLEPGERIAILLKNGLDWVCFDMAGHRLGLPVVGLYTNDTPTNVAYVLSDARPSVILMDTAARWAEIAPLLDGTDFLHEVWLQEAGDGAAAPPGDAPPVTTLDAVLAREVPRAPDMEVAPEATAALIYTSGTTGAPKGAMLSHRAILTNADAARQVVPPLRSDVFLSILPMAHAFERSLGYVLPVMTGSTVAYAQSLQRLRADLAEIRPSVIIGVPRLYEAIYRSAERAAAESPVKHALFERAARIGWARQAEARGLGAGPALWERAAWPVLERLVCRKVMAAFGGRMRVAVSGGAALEPPIARDLIGLGLPLVEGYGLTEAGPMLTASRVEEYIPGTVGYAVPGTKLRVTEAGDLEAHTPSRMTGYWQRPEATAEMFDAEGWLATGDLAGMQGRTVRITGRRKHIIVLSNGENVNPEPIETAILGDALFEQACVVGEGKTFVAALLVLDEDVWREVTEEHGLPVDDPNATAARPEIMRRLKAHLGEFPAHHQIRGYHAQLEDWTLEQGLLTPTLKLRRERVTAAHADEIAAIYGTKNGTRRRSG